MQEQKDGEYDAKAQEERRAYTRVQDAVGLHIQRQVDVPVAGQQSAASTDVRTPVRRRDKYDIEGYGNVRSDYPAVADYISELEERIRELLLDADTPVSKPTHKVSLSAGGVLFTERQRFALGEVISLMITVFPTGARIGSDAVIVEVSPSKGGANADAAAYRAAFIHMSDGDRDAIQAHVDQLLSKRRLLED